MAEREHELKVWPAYYDALESGEKPFEVRRDDRGFQRGDTLWLREWRPHDRIAPYTRRECRKLVTYILTGGQFGIEPGFVVLGLANPPAQEPGVTG